MVLPFRIIRDVCDSIFGLSSQGASVVVLAVFICGGFHFNILRISGNRVLMKSAILLSERVISDYNPVLSYSLTINDQHLSVSLQDTSLGVCGVFHPLLIAIPGQIPVHPGWVICAIWINGSELLDPAFCDFESDISSR